VRAAVLGRAGTKACLRVSPRSVLTNMSSVFAGSARARSARGSPNAASRCSTRRYTGGVRKAAGRRRFDHGAADAHSIARCRPILEAMGRQIFLTGRSVSGSDEGAETTNVSARASSPRRKRCSPPSASAWIRGNVARHPSTVDRENNSTLNKFHQFICSPPFDSGFSLG